MLPAWIEELLTENGWAYDDYYQRMQAKRAAKQQLAEHSEDADGQEKYPDHTMDVVPPTELVPHEIPGPYEQRPSSMEPDHVEVAHAIFAYARRIGYPRLQIGDIVIEADRGWTGFVYSPEVTWEQRLQVYQYVLVLLRT